MSATSRVVTKKTAIVLVAILAILAGSALTVNTVQRTVKQIFRLNEQLKSEGYYLAEFEFKMLGCAYYLDKGEYVTALSRLSEIRRQYESRVGLVRVPAFASKKDELEFYLNLQNPKTGAFMDDRYPLFTYIGPTSNVLSHIEMLCIETAQPLRLKYPLLFLDEISTPDRLRIFLDDLATVGIVGSKFRAPYIEATELNGYPEDMKRTGVYTLSLEWTEALRQWFYDNQDQKTGYWGPRLRSSGELLNSGDLLSTEKALKFFWQGHGFRPEFPLKYGDRIFATTLAKLSEPMPEDLDDVHEWTLVMNRGTRLMTRYLWSEASPQNKADAKKRIEEIVRGKSAAYFVKSEGAFSLYPGATHADLDGTGEVVDYLKEVGALSAERQRTLWGPTEVGLMDLGTHKVSEVSQEDFAPVMGSMGVNSIRVYRLDDIPSDYTSGVVCVCYPKPTPVLDIVELLPRVSQWANTTSQSMGNWVSREDIIGDLAGVTLERVTASTGDIPLQIASETLRTSGGIVVIGFDVLQVPRCQLILRRK